MKKPTWVPLDAVNALARYATKREVLSNGYVTRDDKEVHAIKLTVMSSLVLSEAMRPVWEAVTREASAIRSGKKVLANPMISDPAEAYRFLIYLSADTFQSFLIKPKLAVADVRADLKEIARLARTLSRKMSGASAQYYLNQHIGALDVFWNSGNRDLWYHLLESKITIVDVLKNIEATSRHTIAKRMGNLSRPLSRPNAANAHRAYVGRGLSRYYFEAAFGAPHHRLVSIMLNVIFPNATPRATANLVRQLVAAA